MSSNLGHFYCLVLTEISEEFPKWMPYKETTGTYGRCRTESEPLDSPDKVVKNTTVP